MNLENFKPRSAPETQGEVPVGIPRAGQEDAFAKFEALAGEVQVEAKEIEKKRAFENRKRADDDAIADITTDIAKIYALNTFLEGNSSENEVPHKEGMVGQGGDFGGAGASGSFEAPEPAERESSSSTDSSSYESSSSSDSGGGGGD